MTSTWIAALIAAAAIATTYLFCVRPALRGGQSGNSASHHTGANSDAENESCRQLAELRQELRELRAAQLGGPPAASERGIEQR